MFGICLKPLQPLIRRLFTKVCFPSLKNVMFPPMATAPPEYGFN